MATGRRWSLPQKPLEVREDGVPVDLDVETVDFIGLQVTAIAAGEVQVTDALFGGANAGITHITCVRESGCEYYKEVVFLTDSKACILRREAC